MPELKILHMSDLLLGPEANNEAYASIVSQLAGKLPSKIDYMVISGNLTADGSEASFAEAERALTGAAGRLLCEDGGSLRRNRILIVPGRRDAQNGAGYEAFAAFHDRFFAAEIKAKRVEPFDAKRGDFRQLKDVTLVGLCYWQPRPDYASDRVVPALPDLVPAVRKAAEGLVRIAYTVRTPTIIASANPLAFHGDAGEEPNFRALRAALRDSFTRAVHLFGGEASATLPSPWTLEFLGLGTGMRSGSLWPFTANVLRIRRASLRETDAPPSAILCNSVYYQAGATHPLEKSDQIEGQLDLLYGTEATVTRDCVYGNLLETIEKALMRKRQVIVRGFPGAGKLFFYEYMKRRDRLNKQKVHVIARQLLAPLDEDLRDDIQREMNDFRKQHRKDVWPLLLLHDGRRLTMLNGDKSEKLRALNSIIPQDLYVVLLQPEDDYTLAAESADDRELVLPFPPLRMDEVRQLVQEFSCCAPADERTLRAVTGGYAGFSEMILDETSKAFSVVSGAEPIQRQIASVMTDRAVATKQIQQESRVHREILARKAGAEICNYIEAKVRKKREDAKVPVSELPPIEIVVDELRTQLRDDAPKLAAIDTTLEKLSAAGILGPKATQDGRTIYPVEVLTPFVVSERGSAPAAGRDPAEWPEVTDTEVEGPADIVIITALPQEQEAVLRKLPNRRQVDPHEQFTYVYHFAKVPVTFPSGQKTTYRVAVTCLLQMGQVQSALVAQEAILRWNPRAVLLVGIAGGVRTNGIAVGDVLTAHQVAYYEEQKVKEEETSIRWQMIPVDPKLIGWSQNLAIHAAVNLLDVVRPGDGEPHVHRGPVATGNKVIAAERLLREYEKTLPKLAGVEMEAWGVATAAFQASRPRRFFLVRGVSDLADADKDSTVIENWRPYACDIAASYAIALLRSGPLPAAASNEGGER